MSSIAPVEALLSIDPESIPDVNHRDFLMYGTDAIKTLFQFYRTSKADTYQGHKVFPTGLLTGATKESLELEYGGYKNYVSNQKMSCVRNSIQRKRHWQLTSITLRQTKTNQITY